MMKRICVLCLIATLVLCSAAFCFAAEASAPEESTAEASAPIAKSVAGLDFTGPVIELTLEESLNAALTDGSAIKAAEIKKKADKASERSSLESANRMTEANDSASESDDTSSSTQTYSRAELEQARKAQEYYSNMSERNYEAAKNQIIYDVNNAYYELLHAEESAGIAEENLKLQEKLLATVEQKVELGAASKQDLLQTEISLNSAESELASAELALAEKKMSFNISLGLEPMQDVKLTTPLEMLEIPALDLETAITSALENRNDLYTLAYNIYSAQKELDALLAYPKSSSRYLTAQNSLNSAQKSYDDKESSLRKEISLYYAGMNNDASSVENAKLSAEKSEESYGIYLAKYELGMVTLSEAQQAQLDLYQSERNYASSVLKYNLSVIQYEQSATVGMSQNQ